MAVVSCIWCANPIDEDDQLQLVYTTCRDCLVPLPTE